MFRKKTKVRQSFSGGYKQYRSPLVFGSRRKKPKKEIALPKIQIGWKYVLYLIILVAVIYFVFFSKKLAINEVIVEGNKTVTVEKLSSYIKRGSNILFFNSNSTRKKILTENPQIKDVEILRGIPDTVKIVVLEHENKLIWQSSGTNYLVSTQGKVTKKVEDGETFNYPVLVDAKNVPVTISKNIVSPNFVAFTTNVFDKFFDATNIKPTTFVVPETTFDLYLNTEAGFYVKLNTMRSSGKQLENLKKVLVEKRQDIHEYVDLRIDGWAYYK